MEKISTFCASILGVAATLSTVLVMITIVLEVLWRNLVGESLPGVLELSETCLVFAIFLGLASAGVNYEHIAVNLVTDRLPRRVSGPVRFVIWVLVTFILLWLVIASADRAIDSTVASEVRTGIINWALWPSRWAIVIGLGAMLIVSLTNVVRATKGRIPMGADKSSLSSVEP
jgi:TRAP-type C4-dicarboxylate transport system permease small subunit